MVTLDTLRAERRKEILQLAERRGAHTLRVFGSVARGDDHEGSDVDLLVDDQEGLTYFDLGKMQVELEDCLGVRVDVGLADALRPRIRENVMSDLRAL